MASDGKYSALDLSRVQPEEMPSIIQSFERDMQRAGLSFTGLEYGYLTI